MAKPVASWLSRAHLGMGGEVKFVRKTLDDEGRVWAEEQMRPKRVTTWSTQNFQIPETRIRERYRYVRCESLDLSKVQRHVDLSEVVAALGYAVPHEDGHRCSVYTDQHGLDLVIPEWTLVEALLDTAPSSFRRWSSFFQLGFPHHLLNKIDADTGVIFCSAMFHKPNLVPDGFYERIAYFLEQPDAAGSLGSCIFTAWSTGQIRLNPIPLQTGQCLFKGYFCGSAFVVEQISVRHRVFDFPIENTYQFRIWNSTQTVKPNAPPTGEELWLEPSGIELRRPPAIRQSNPFFEPFEGRMRFRSERFEPSQTTRALNWDKKAVAIWSAEKLI